MHEHEFGGRLTANSLLLCTEDARFIVNFRRGKQRKVITMRVRCQMTMQPHLKGSLRIPICRFEELWRSKVEEPKCTSLRLGGSWPRLYYTLHCHKWTKKRRKEQSYIGREAVQWERITPNWRSGWRSRVSLSLIHILLWCTSVQSSTNLFNTWSETVRIMYCIRAHHNHAKVMRLE